MIQMLALRGWDCWGLKEHFSRLVQKLRLYHRPPIWSRAQNRSCCVNIGYVGARYRNHRRARVDTFYALLLGSLGNGASQPRVSEGLASPARASSILAASAARPRQDSEFRQGRSKRVSPKKSRQFNEAQKSPPAQALDLCVMTGLWLPRGSKDLASIVRALRVTCSMILAWGFQTLRQVEHLRMINGLHESMQGSNLTSGGGALGFSL